jgi:formylglycine-generating enzyme required for sulfatase activity
LTIESEVGITNQIEFTTNLFPTGWTPLATVVVVQSPYWFADVVDPPAPQRFYRVAAYSPNIPALTNIALVPLLKIASDVGITNQIQFASQVGPIPWTALTNVVVVQSPYLFVDFAAPFGANRLYRVVAYPPNNPPAPTNMALILAGSFQMGDNLDSLSDALPIHTVDVSAFYIDKSEVTKKLWDEVYQWAITNGYNFEFGAQSVASNHPVHSITWYDAAKWCNARSEQEGRVPAYYTSLAQTNVYRSGQINLQAYWVQWNAGYRLPTEAEWEKAARGGVDGNRFPWSDTNTIAHSRANYFSFWQGEQPFYPYDVSSTSGYHPMFSAGAVPYTSPAGYFAANGYGLYDMAGNVWEWCWDWWSDNYYSSSPGSNPLGTPSGSYRILRGGSWATDASGCRTANRGNGTPESSFNSIGFRSVLPQG